MTQTPPPTSGLAITQLLVLSQVPKSTTFQLLWTLARFAVGALMIHNGFNKLDDVQGFADNVVAFMGLPYPVFLTYCAAYVEIISSVGIILGLQIRANAIALLGTMAVAIFFHLKADGLAVAPLETAALYATFYLCFLIGGSGKFALDAIVAERLGLE